MAPLPYSNPIDVRAELARIDRERVATCRMLDEGAKRLAAPDGPWMAPLSIVLGMIVAAIVWRLPEVLHAFGVGR